MQGGLNKSQRDSSIIPIDLITSKIQQKDINIKENKNDAYEKFYEENFKYIKPGKNFKHFKECNEIFKSFHNNNFFRFVIMKKYIECRYTNKAIARMNELYPICKDVIPVLLGNEYFIKYFDKNIIDNVIKHYDVVKNTKSKEEIQKIIETFNEDTNELFLWTNDCFREQVNKKDFIGLDTLYNTFSPFFSLFKDNPLFDVYNRINPSLNNTFDRFVCKVETFYELDTPENKDKIMNFVFQYIVNYLLTNTNNGYLEKIDDIDECDCFVMFNNIYELYDAYEDIINYIIEKYIQ